MVYLNLYGERDEFPEDKDIFYYTHYIEFHKYIEFRILDKNRIYKNRIIPFSEYASCMEDVFKLLRKYNSERYIVYNSSNTRPVKSRKDADVTYRRTFYFDVESNGKKPPLTDKNYYMQLLETTLYLRDCLDKERTRISLVKETGRGFLVGVKTEPLRVNDGSDMDKKFILWFKKFIEKYEPGRPHKNIKFSDGVFNLSRIEGSPLFRHMKYPEQPFRRVIYLSNNWPMSIQALIEKIKVPKRLILKSKYSKKYNIKTIWKCPEWRLLTEHQDLPEGDLHTKIITALKILFRDAGIPMEVLTEALSLIGYNEAPDIPDPETYHYTPNMYNNWCWKNYEYCLNNKIKLINIYKTDREFSWKLLTEEDWKERHMLYFTIKERTLESFTDILNYIKEFNTKVYMAEVFGKTVSSIPIYKDLVRKNIERLVFDKKLLEYIDFNGIYNHIFASFNFGNKKEDENNPRSN